MYGRAMSSEVLNDILSQLKRWPWQRPVSALAAAAVMRSVVTTGITDPVQVVAVSCHAIVRWSTVYDLFEVSGGIPAAALCSALQYAGHNVAQDSLGSLLGALGKPECIDYDLFIAACAFAQLPP
ncbi:hypothetical protein HPB50_012930 [Hyalomma asiaticum]|uniref:Uncharacterized protein n=1 Tax=Hyalomma asiaticum TaxID=266040 RepID=A0ACB7RW12_HYAAI|nr:hypothetical protein HPB50_012930 [Hyalomma asiaticum]